MKVGKTFTGTTRAWLAGYDSMHELNSRIDSGATERAVGLIQFSNHDMSDHGWTNIGTASITVTLDDADTIVSNQVAVLQQELQKARAESFMREQAITDKINSLLAIENDTPASANNPDNYPF